METLGFNQLKTCSLCSQEVETLEHLLLRYQKIQSYRNKYIELQKLCKENMREEMATKVLLNKNREQSNEWYVIFGSCEKNQMKYVSELFWNKFIIIYKFINNKFIIISLLFQAEDVIFLSYLYIYICRYIYIFF